MPQHHAHPEHGRLQETGGMSFEEKLYKLLEHWIKHNDDHVANYRQWAERCKSHHLKQTGLLLGDAAEMTLGISKKFETAMKLLRRQRPE